MNGKCSNEMLGGTTTTTPTTEAAALATVFRIVPLHFECVFKLEGINWAHVCAKVLKNDWRWYYSARSLRAPLSWVQIYDSCKQRNRALPMMLPPILLHVLDVFFRSLNWCIAFSNWFVRFRCDSLCPHQRSPHSVFSFAIVVIVVEMYSIAMWNEQRAPSNGIMHGAAFEKCVCATCFCRFAPLNV